MGLDQNLFVRARDEEFKYWRKFGELHNLIVDRFEREHGYTGEDNCHEFDLCKEDIEYILNCLRKKELPGHEGFFFGGSNKEDDEYINDAIKTFEGALALVKMGKEVYYHAWY